MDYDRRHDRDGIEITTKRFIGRIDDCKRTITREKEKDFFIKNLEKLPSIEFKWDNIVTRIDDLMFLERLGYKLTADLSSIKWTNAVIFDDLWVLELEKGRYDDPRKRFNCKVFFRKRIAKCEKAAWEKVMLIAKQK
jgi:hypothetical protein